MTAVTHNTYGPPAIPCITPYTRAAAAKHRWPRRAADDRLLEVRRASERLLVGADVPYERALGPKGAVLGTPVSVCLCVGGGAKAPGRRRVCGAATAPRGSRAEAATPQPYSYPGARLGLVRIAAPTAAAPTPFCSTTTTNTTTTSSFSAMAVAQPSAYETLIQAATSEDLHGVENWELNIGVSDRVSADGPAGARTAIGALAPRIVHRDAGVRATALSVAHGIAENASPESRALVALASPVFCEALVQSATYRHASQAYRTKVLEYVENWHGQLQALGAPASAQADTMYTAMEAVRSTVAGGLARYHVEPPPPEQSVEELRREDEELRKALELSLQDSVDQDEWEPNIPEELRAALGAPAGAPAGVPRPPPPPPPPLPQSLQPSRPTSSATAPSGSAQMNSTRPASQGMPPTPLHPPPPPPPPPPHPQPSHSSAPTAPPAPRPVTRPTAETQPPRPTSPTESEKTWNSAQEEMEGETGAAPTSRAQQHASVPSTSDHTFQNAPQSFSQTAPALPKRTPASAAAAAAAAASTNPASGKDSNAPSRSHQSLTSTPPVEPGQNPPVATRSPPSVPAWTPTAVPGMVTDAPPPARVQALHDFAPDDEGELAMKRGDVITVLEAQFDHWWRGEAKGKIGIFPKNYVKELPTVTFESLMATARKEMDVEAMAPTIYSLLDRLRNPPGPASQYNAAADDELRNMYTASLTAWSNLVGVVNAYTTRLATMRALNETFETADKLFRESMHRALQKTSDITAQRSVPEASVSIPATSATMPLHLQALNYATAQHSQARLNRSNQGAHYASSAPQRVDTPPESSQAPTGPPQKQQPTPASYNPPTAQIRYPSPPPGLKPSDPAYAEWYYANIGIPPGTTATTSSVPANQAHSAVNRPNSVLPLGANNGPWQQTDTPASSQATPQLAQQSAQLQAVPQVTKSPPQAVPQPPPGLKPSDPAYAEWYYTTFGPPAGIAQHGPLTQVQAHNSSLASQQLAPGLDQDPHGTPTPVIGGQAVSASPPVFPAGAAVGSTSAPGSSSGTAGQLLNQDVPKDEEKRRLFEQARAEVAQHQQQLATSHSGTQHAPTSMSPVGTPSAGPIGHNDRPVPGATLGPIPNLASPDLPPGAPRDEEKRRLFEKAQAEVAQFQQQHTAAHVDANSMGRPLSTEPSAGPSAGGSNARSGSSQFGPTPSSAPDPVMEMPRDEEKRKLFERARAEVAQFQNQHQRQPFASPSNQGERAGSPGYQPGQVLPSLTAPYHPYPNNQHGPYAPDSHVESPPVYRPN